MIVAVALTAVMLAGLTARRRISLAAGAAAVLALGAGLIAGRLLNGFVADRNYDGRQGDEVASTLSSLDHLEICWRSCATSPEPAGTCCWRRSESSASYSCSPARLQRGGFGSGTSAWQA